MFSFGTADHLLVIPVDDIRDMLAASPGRERGRWHVEARGRPGAGSLRLYVPSKQYRDADAWYEVLGQLVDD